MFLVITNYFLITSLFSPKTGQLYIVGLNLLFSGFLLFDLRIRSIFSINLLLLIILQVFLEVLMVLLQHLTTQLKSLLLILTSLLELLYFIMDDSMSHSNQKHFLLLLQKVYNWLLQRSILSILLSLFGYLQCILYDLLLFCIVGSL